MSAGTTRSGAGRLRPGLRSRPGRVALAWAAALALVCSGCGMTQMQNLAFRVDNRLQFVSPPNRSLVTNPVTVRWRMSDFRTRTQGSGGGSGGAGYFAVFVDQAPIRPGQTMRAVAGRDLRCLHQAGCPDPAYLAARQIYTTTNPQLTLGQIPPIGGDAEAIQLHTVTVVLMDPSGHRIGESAWELDLRMRKVGF